MPQDEKNLGQPLNKELRKDNGAKRILATEAPISKDYINKIDIDVDAYKKAQKDLGLGSELSPKLYKQNQDKIQKYQEREQIRLNDIKANNQSTMDKVGNGLVKFGGRVFTSVVGSTIGAAYGVASWIKDGDFQSFYDNEFQDSLDGINEYLAKEFPHYYTSDKEDWEIGNFVFDKVFDGLGFATGAVISGMTGAGIAGKIGQGVGWFTKGMKTASYVPKWANKYQKVERLRKAANKVGKTSNIDLEGIGKTATSMITGAVYESGVEARHTFDETLELLEEEFIKSNGRAANKSERAKLAEYASETANGVFLANMVLVGAGNYIQFGRHIGMDFGDIKKAFTPKIAKKVTEEGAEKYIKSGKAWARKTAKFMKAPITESQEEMLQSVFSETGKDFAALKYNQEGYADLTDLLKSSASAFKKVYGSKEGWEEGLIGAIVGSAGVFAPSRVRTEDGKSKISWLKGGLYEAYKDHKAEEELRNTIVDKLNNTPITEAIRQHAAHMVRDAQLEEVKTAALEANDRYIYENAKNDQFHSYLMAREAAGMFNSVYDDINDLRKMSLEEYKKIANISEDIDFTEEDKTRELDSYVRRANAIKNSIKRVDRAYKGNDSDIREELIYNHATANRLAERMERVAQEINELSGLAIGREDIKAKDKETNEYTGEYKTAQEVFKNIDWRKTTNSVEYKELYEDYKKLDKRAEKLIKDFNEVIKDPLAENILIKKRKDDFLKEVAKVEEKRREAEVQELEIAEGQEEDLAFLMEQEAKEKIKSIADVSKRINLDPDTESTTEISEELEADILDLIEGTENPENVLDDVLAVLRENDIDVKLNNLPLSIRQSLKEALQGFENAAEKINRDENDPTAISDETIETESTQINKVNSINHPDKTVDEPPIDIENLNEETKRNVEKAIRKSNDGKVIGLKDNQEVQKDSSGIVRLGGKVVDAAIHMAIKTRKFFKREDGTIQELDELNSDTTIDDLLASDTLLPGTELQIKLGDQDTYSGYDENDQWQENIPNKKNSPDQVMEIYNNKDLIGYIHNDSFIRPERVAKTFNKGEDNIERNRQVLKEIRAKIFDHLKDGKNESYPVKIKKKGPGQILVKANKKYDSPLSDIFQDDLRPAIGVIKEGGIYVNGAHISEKFPNLAYDFSGEIETGENAGKRFSEAYRGATVAIVPAANGQHIISLVRNGKVSESKLDIANIVTNVVEAYLNNDEETLSEYEIENSPESVKDFISTFIYLSPTIKIKEKKKYYLWVGQNKEGKRHVAFYNGDSNPAVYRKESKKDFINFINNSLISVNSGKLADNEIISLGNGVTMEYRDFIKDHLYGNFFSKKVVSSKSGEQNTYVANPYIQLDFGVEADLGTLKTVSTKPKTVNTEDYSDIETGEPVTVVEPEIEDISTDIESQKADIEKRRQEELKNTVTKTKLKEGELEPKENKLYRSLGEGGLSDALKTFKLRPNENNSFKEVWYSKGVEGFKKVLGWATKYQNEVVILAEIDSDAVKTKGGSYAQYDVSTPEQISLGEVTIYELRENEAFKYTVDKIKVDKINAKYDAELAALEESSKEEEFKLPPPPSKNNAFRGLMIDPEKENDSDEFSSPSRNEVGYNQEVLTKGMGLRINPKSNKMISAKEDADVIKSFYFIIHNYVVLNNKEGKKKVNVKKAIDNLEADVKKFRNYYKEFSKLKTVSKEHQETYAVHGTQKENLQKLEIFDRTLANFDSYVEDALREMESMNFSVKRSSTTLEEKSQKETIDINEQVDEGIEETLAGEESSLEKKSYEDGATFQENPIDKLSSEVKLMLSTIPDGGANVLGLATYHDLETVYNSILDILSNTFSETFEETLSRLELHSETKPYLRQVVNMLRSEEISQKAKIGFHHHFKHAYMEHELVLFENTGEQNYSTRVIKVNRNSLSNLILENWLLNTGKANVFTEKNGVVSLNEKFIEKNLANKWEKLQVEDPSIADVKDFLKALGVDIKTKTLKHIKENPKLVGGAEAKEFKDLFNPNNNLALFAQLYKAFDLTTPFVEGEHPLNTSSELRKLAAIEATFTEDLSTKSFRNSENKIIFSYVKPTWLNRVFSKIKSKEGIIDKEYVSKLRSIPFLSRSLYLQKLAEGDKKWVDNFNLSVTDTLKLKGKEGRKFSSLSEREKVLAQINLFINDQQGSDASNNEYKIGKFITAKSDKSVLHIITAIRIKTKFLKGGSLDSNTKKNLLNIVESEYARIIDSQKYGEERNLSNLEGYNPNIFYQFPELNFVKELYNEDGTLKRYSKELEKYILPVLENAVLEEERKTKEELENLGIIDGANLRMINKKYLDSLGDNKVESFLRDYVVNNMVANANYQQIFQGDVAFAYKEAKRKDHQDLIVYDRNGIEDTVATERNFLFKSVELTFANMNKRLAKDMAPAVMMADLNNDPEFKSYKQIILKDATNSSLNMKQLTDIYKDKDSVIDEYLKITSTDAQEVTTLEEHLDVMYYMGRLDKSTYERLKKIATSSEPYFNPEDLKIVLQPMKPVYVGNEVSEKYNVAVPVYIKSSSFPLVPQLIKDSEFGKLEKAMRKAGVRRAVFESGSKLGTHKSIDVWNKREENDRLSDGTFNEAALSKKNLEESAITLDRNNFGIQQEVPFKEGKNKILEGSQIMKLILPGIKSETKRNLFNELHNEIIESEYNLFLEELGLQEITDETGTRYEDTTNGGSLEKLRDMLIAELHERGTYNRNDELALELLYDKDNKAIDFKIPIWSGPKSSQFESMLNSIINKKVLRQKISGESKVLGTEAGWKGDLSNVERVDSRELTGTAWDSEKGLRPQRYGWVDSKGVKYEEDDPRLTASLKKKLTRKVFPAQVLVTKSNFRQKKIVGYRIPTQDLNSMSAMEVVGYLPDYMADLIIAPQDFVTQMGSDFDIDKLYLHRWHEDSYGNISESGTTSQLVNKLLRNITNEDLLEEDFTSDEIKEIKNSVDSKKKLEHILRKKVLQNEIMDLYWEALTDETNLERILAPLGFGNLPKTAKNVEKALKGTEYLRAFSPLSPLYQIKNYENGNAGKFGVSVTSLASTTNALLQVAKKLITLKKETKKGSGVWKDVEFKFKINVDGKLKVIPLSKINDKETTIDGTMTKADVISAFQSASVDNIKELLIKTLNYNKHTHDAFLTLAYLGLNDTYISYFLAQPIIRDYVKNRSNISDNFSEVKKKREEVAYAMTEAKYKKNITEGTEIEKDIALSEEELLNAITDNDSAIQLAILEKFKALTESGKSLNGMIRATQPATSGIGKDRLTAIGKEVAVKEFLDDKAIENGDTLFDETIAGKGVDILARTNILFSRWFKNTDVAMTLIDNLHTNLGDFKTSYTERERNKMMQFIKSFLYSSRLNLYKGEDPSKLRERLLFGKDSLAHRWDKFKSDNPGSWLGKRVNVRISASSKYPNTIEYKASAADRSDDIRNTHSLIEMLLSDNSEIVQLAEDTIKYAYINGGIQNAVSISKFIPINYLNTTGFGNSINKNIKTLNHRNLLKQYLQHYPYHAYQADDNFELEGGQLKVGTDLIKKGNIQFVSLELGNNKWKLFERVSNKYYKGGNYTYFKEVDLLGTSILTETDYNSDNLESKLTNISEISPSDEAIIAQLEAEMSEDPAMLEAMAAAMAQEYIPVVEDKQINTAPETENVLITKNKNPFTKELSLDEGNVTKVLSKLADNNKNTLPQYKVLARLLMPYVADATIEMEVGLTKETGDDGQYNKNTKHIRIDSSITNRHTLTRVILHEVAHHALHNILDNPSDAQKPHVQALKNAFEHFKNNYEATDNLSEDTRLAAENAKKNIHEFVNELISDLGFQTQVIDSIPFEKSESLLQRILKIINELFNSNAKNLTKSEKESTLALISEVVSLLENTNQNITPKEEISSKVVDSIDIVIKDPLGLSDDLDIDMGDLINPEDMGSPSRRRDREDSLIREKYFPVSNVTDSVTILEKISKSKHPLNKVADSLIKYAKNQKIDVHLVNNIETVGLSEIPAGLYNGKEILIRQGAKFRGLGSEPTIIHEVLHSLSAKALSQSSNKDFEKMLEKAKEVIGDVKPDSELGYALTNTDEFLVALFTNSKLINALKGIDPISNVKKYNNLLEEIMDYILSLFKLNKGEVSESLYSQAYAVATNIIGQQDSMISSLKEYDSEIGFRSSIFEEMTEREIQEYTKNCNL